MSEPLTSLQMLQRVESALQSMVETAAFETSTGCLAAVTHGAYLRLLLGAVEGFSVFVATSQQANCCINVIDFARPSSPTKSSPPSSLMIPDSGFQLPQQGRVIRVNENRHLASIAMRASLAA